MSENILPHTLSLENILFFYIGARSKKGRPSQKRHKSTNYPWDYLHNGHIYLIYYHWSEGDLITTPCEDVLTINVFR